MLLARALPCLSRFACVIVLSCAAFANTPLQAQGVTYVTGFEVADGFAEGPIQGQPRWEATGGIASVTSLDYSAGSQSVTLQPGTILRADVTQSDVSQIVFTDFFVRAVATSDPASTTRISTTLSNLRFVREGQNALLEYQHQTDTGITWMRTATAVTIAVDGKFSRWARVTLRENYATKETDVYIDGTLVACRILSGTETAIGPAGCTVTAGLGAETGLDDFYAGPDNPVFADTNRNGMSDAWEQQWNLSLSADNRDGDPDADGARNIEEFMRDTDPVTGSHTLTITEVETAGIAGFRPLWNTAIPLAENGAVQTVSSPYGNGAGPTAYWMVGTFHPWKNSVIGRPDASVPGPIVFDAVHRSLLVRFPTAGASIASVLNQGFRVAKAEIILPYRDVEMWPEYYREMPGLSLVLPVS